MLGDSLTFTVNAVAKTLVKINQDKYSAEYHLREADKVFKANVRHNTYTKAGVVTDRHNIEFIEQVLPTATTPLIERKQYVVFEHASTDTSVNVGYDVKALAGFLTDPNIAKLVNYES